MRARDGAFDAVVTMYHDQGQIAMKLLGFERGITIHAGLPIPITTPAHGTAFDIAGRGIARVDGLAQAYRTACRMALKPRAELTRPAGRQGQASLDAGEERIRPARWPCRSRAQRPRRPKVGPAAHRARSA